MTKIILELNINKPDTISFAKQIINYLHEKNCEVYARYNLEKFLPNTKILSGDEKIIHSDYILALGGDGTLLSCARRYLKFNKPILGINLGNLGYLTSVEKSNAFFAIDNLLQKNFQIEKRSMLQIKNNEKLTALNDICIGKSIASRLICFDLFINNNFIDCYKADGIIISTPSGSTAYNLSAGGPIIKPTLPVFVLTPICAHTLYSRPIVISDSDETKICLKSEFDETKIIFDGQEILPMQKEITITRSIFSANIIKTNSSGFYDILRQKLFK